MRPVTNCRKHSRFRILNTIYHKAVKGENGKYFAHTLNNTVVAPPRMLIAFLENNLQADGSVKIPAALRPYMGGMEVMVPKK